MQELAAEIPGKLLEGMKEEFSTERASHLRDELKILIKALS